MRAKERMMSKFEVDYKGAHRESLRLAVYEATDMYEPFTREWEQHHRKAYQKKMREMLTPPNRG